VLLAYGAKNFCSFKEWFDIDLRLNSKVPTDISNGHDYATAICLKGHNGFGKTNALKALSFLKYFVSDSFSLKPDSNINFETYFRNDQPSEFYIKFRQNEIEYEYELKLTNQEVLEEKISKKLKRKTIVIHRKGTELLKNTLYDLKQKFPLRRNASIISTAIQFEIQDFLPIYDFFKLIIVNVSSSGYINILPDEYKLAEYFKENQEAFDFVKNKLVEFDIGISDINISSFKKEDGEEKYFPVFLHYIDEARKTLSPLIYEEESSGTKTMFQYLQYFYWVLKSGGVIALDEFDTLLHAALLPILVEMFIDSKKNINQSQMLFSTHNTEIMDIMGKYRTILFQKKNGESFCYRLDEFKDNLLRNDRSIISLYKDGKLGGYPEL